MHQQHTGVVRIKGLYWAIGNVSLVVAEGWSLGSMIGHRAKVQYSYERGDIKAWILCTRNASQLTVLAQYYFILKNSASLAMRLPS